MSVKKTDETSVSENKKSSAVQNANPAVNKIKKLLPRSAAVRLLIPAAIIAVCICVLAVLLIRTNSKPQQPVQQPEPPLQQADAQIDAPQLQTGEDEYGNRPFVRPEKLAPSPINESKLNPDFPADLTRALKVNMVDSEKRVAYLTFDDGPSENTVEILDILSRYGVKATFFLLGSNAEKHPELVKRIFDEGHTPANHTYSHVYDEIYSSPEVLRSEIYKTEDVIAGIIGRQNVIKLFRFPGGSTGRRQENLRGYIGRFGYRYVDWNALNGDAEKQHYTYDYCISRIKDTCSDTGDVIVLMHDAAEKQMTVAALPEIIEYLTSLGYSFERIVP